jgi:UPF0755 protein
MRRRLLALAVLAAISVGVVIAVRLYTALHRPGPATATTVEVAAGAPMLRVLEDLHRAELLPSVLAGRIYLRAFAADRTFRFGTYTVPAHSRPVDVLEQLLAGRVDTQDVTIIEGLLVSDIADRFVAAGIGSADEWQALTDDPRWVTDLAPAAPSLEGFLFPDTYTFAVGTPAAAAARHLVGRFRSVWDELTATREPWGTPLEVVTLASLVEAETGLAEERARVAGVFTNRLARGMLLQCDPTVVYALKRRGEWSGRLLRVHWGVEDPYNTYYAPGLPPGPINSPGRSALAAALDPEPHRYLYFVARPGGGHDFSRTLAEHNRAVARLRRARR